MYKLEYMILHSCFPNPVSTIFMAYFPLLVKYNLEYSNLQTGITCTPRYTERLFKEYMGMASFKGIYLLISTPCVVFPTTDLLKIILERFIFLNHPPSPTSQQKSLAHYCQIVIYQKI